MEKVATPSIKDTKVSRFDAMELRRVVTVRCDGTAQTIVLLTTSEKLRRRLTAPV